MTVKVQKSRIVLIVTAVIALIAVVFCVAGAGALVVDVKSSALPSSQEEGSNVKYSFVISGIPEQAKTLDVSTDLIPVVDASLWTIKTDGVKMLGGANTSLIHLTAESGFPKAITIDVVGKVPVITTTTAVDGVTVVKRPAQRSAYHYYHVEALDSDGKLVGGDSTGVLKITVSDEEAFLASVNTIDNVEFRSIITSMYSNGLTYEAWDLLNWYKTQPGSMPIFIPIIIGIVALIIGLAAGYVIVSRRFSDESSE